MFGVWGGVQGFPRVGVEVGVGVWATHWVVGLGWEGLGGAVKFINVLWELKIWGGKFWRRVGVFGFSGLWVGEGFGEEVYYKYL